MSRFALLSLIVATLLAGEAIYWMIRYGAEKERDELRRRLHLIDSGSPPALLLRPGRFSRSPLVDRRLAAVGLLRPFGDLLAQTDLSWTVVGLFGRSALYVFSGILIGVLLGSPFLGALIGLAGSALPTLWALERRRCRSTAISKQLPEALDLLARSLRAGHALPASLKLAAQELPIPVAAELARSYEEHSLGEPIDTAIQNIVTRVPQNLDIRIFAAAVIINQQVGGNIAEVFDRIAGTIRERYKFYGQLRALTAEGRLSGILLASMPWLVLVIVWFVRRDYLTGFVGDPLGRGIAMGGFASWAIGIVWMRKLVRLDV